MQNGEKTFPPKITEAVHVHRMLESSRSTCLLRNNKLKPLVSVTFYKHRHYNQIANV